MKSFDVKMLDTGGNKVAANVKGQGVVEFETVVAEYQTILGIRKDCAKKFGELGGDDFSNEDAVSMQFQLAVSLVQTTVLPTLTADEASVLVALTGGSNKGLVEELALKFGVADILLSGSEDGGDQEELPM